ncbi:hypothetical protein ACFQX6_14455 [Streptosporangium lutulentum]
MLNGYGRAQLGDGAIDQLAVGQVAQGGRALDEPPCRGAAGADGVFDPVAQADPVEIAVDHECRLQCVAEPEREAGREGAGARPRGNTKRECQSTFGNRPRVFAGEAVPVIGA